MNRIPVLMRTMNNKITREEVTNKINQMLHLPDEVNHINLRKIFVDSMNNPIKKSEQRDKLNHVIKQAIV